MREENGETNMEQVKLYVKTEQNETKEEEGTRK